MKIQKLSPLEETKRKIRECYNYSISTNKGILCGDEREKLIGYLNGINESFYSPEAKKELGALRLNSLKSSGSPNSSKDLVTKITTELKNASEIVKEEYFLKHQLENNLSDLIYDLTLLQQF